MDDRYGNLRLKKDTIDTLRELKDAYTICYGKPFTFDGVVRQMVSSVEDGDIAVWEIFCLRRQQKEEALKKAGSLKDDKHS